jgi:hypothetical protein
VSTGQGRAHGHVREGEAVQGEGRHGKGFGESCRAAVQGRSEGVQGMVWEREGKGECLQGKC